MRLHRPIFSKERAVPFNDRHIFISFKPSKSTEIPLVFINHPVIREKKSLRHTILKHWPITDR